MFGAKFSNKGRKRQKRGKTKIFNFLDDEVFTGMSKKAKSRLLEAERTQDHANYSSFLQFFRVNRNNQRHAPICFVPLLRQRLESGEEGGNLGCPGAPAL